MKLLFVFLLLSRSLLSQNLDAASTKIDSSKRFTPDTLSADTTGLVSTKKNLAKLDTLIPLQQFPLTNKSFIIGNSSITHYDYRYTADILKKFPFSFVKDAGFIGQQSEIFLFGAGNGGISFLEDGILLNDRYTNSLDLNNVQSEFIDSIEIIPSPRGFLYGMLPNPAAVNFISKDYLSIIPFTRIKYYQGPGEAFVDGLFSALLLKDFNISFDITNRNIDSTFANSDFSIWQAKARLKYFLSNSFNIESTYGYVKLQRGINGGVNVDSIFSRNSDLNSLLYDERFAPVNFLNRKQEYIQHFFNLRLLSKISKNLNGNFDLYFRFNQDKISRISSSFQELKNKNKIYGLSLNQDFSSSLLDLKIIGNYEHTVYNSDVIEGKYYSAATNRIDDISLSSILSLKLLHGNLIPSIFYKSFIRNFTYYKRTWNGLGADLSYLFNREFRLYAGYSNYEDYISKRNIDYFETGINFIEKNIIASFKYFERNLILGNILPEIYYDYYIGYDNYYGYIDFNNIKGLGLEFNYTFRPILIEGDAQYFLNPNLENLIPKFNFTAGIYYKDILFHENLDLKTGFLFYYAGKQNLTPNFSTAVLNFFNGEVPSILRIDFTLAGEIQKAATIFFTWENLLDKKYFITPFYPMPSRNIRFGIAWELFN